MTSAAESIEDARVKVLSRYGAPDATSEDGLDAVTRLAATVCQTPIAIVSFVDTNRWWLKSSVGLEGAHTSRDESFCSLVVAQGRFVAIRDAMDLEHTAQIAQCYSPHVRSYAGAPLNTPDGHTIGALAVMDTMPMALDERHRDALHGLAQQVVTHLELRRHVRVLDETIRELRAAEATILHMAHHDALTGLPGRLLFHDRLEHALRHALRNDETLAVMYLDLDGFKAVNDTRGHAAGDRLLQAVALNLQNALRRSDTVARLGGDEFAIVCPDLRDADNAPVVARKLLEAVRSCGPIDGVPVSASIGIALYPYDGATAETLLSDADTAMYRAKRRGKNTFALSALVGRKGAR
jgi:diguanylate cyclase (GGDEF)-like protein